MSLAFAAVVLFVLLAPGVLTRRSYLSRPFAKRFSATTPTDEVVWAIIPALALHGVGIWCLHLLGYHPSFVSLGHLLVGAKEDTALEAAFLDVDRHLRVIAGYNLCLWGVAVALGFGLRELVIRCSLDLKFRVFRFNNEWYYLLTGRHWGYKVGDQATDDFNVVAVDALVGTGESSVIYSGILVDFYLSSDGGLDSLWLEGISKWVVASSGSGDGGVATDDPGAKPKYRHVEVVVPGNVMVLKYKDILNLDVTFKRINVAAVTTADTVSVGDAVRVQMTPGGVQGPAGGS